MALTDRQENFYKYLREYFLAYGVAPKLSELKDWLELKGWDKIQSLNSLTQYLLALEKEGKIRREGGKRGITIIEGCDTVSIPVITSAASCGAPNTLLNEEISEHHLVSSSLIRDKELTYIFRTTGDSMNNANIDNGDYVLVERTNNLKDGDIVLATIDGCSTIKRFRRGPDTITLLPESTNPNNKPIYLHENDDFVIAGKIIHILKN